MSEQIKNEQQSTMPHQLKILSRVQLYATGVLEVTSFDEAMIIADTVDGEMTVEGEGMHIGTFSTTSGELSVDGKISAVYYLEKKAGMKKSLFRRSDR